MIFQTPLLVQYDFFNFSISLNNCYCIIDINVIPDTTTAVPASDLPAADSLEPPSTEGTEQTKEGEEQKEEEVLQLGKCYKMIGSSMG